jgi:hypothetical protein
MKSTRLALVAIALLSGISAAAAAGNMSQPKTTGSASSMSKPMDKLSLNAQQQKTAWQDISSQATKEKAPSGFTASVGAALPNGLSTHPVPVSTANKVPALQQYQYALLDSNKLLIVNPNDKKIAEVISQ